MSYISHNGEDLGKILAAIGIERPEEVFSSIPPALRCDADLALEGPKDEESLRRDLDFRASRVAFAGGGIYRHHIPAIVDALASRQEFVTAYTPYQPEISQGTLQAIFEYQSMMAGLTGMEVSNASMYDGATALAEAALMALRIKGIRRVAVTRAMQPSYRRVLRTYLAHAEVEAIVEVPFDPVTGQTDLVALEKSIGPDTALFIQSPNYFGVIEPMEQVTRIVSNTAGFWGIVVTEALSLGILKAPGEYGPDVVVGEAQSFGNPAGAGGPLLGFFCTRKEHVRRMPGRVAGLTKDREGSQAFCLTLSTREQHIRREKATSNICTNQGLCALRAAIYLSAMGPEGLKKTALQCAAGARFLKGLLMDKGIAPVFSAPVFHEFVIPMLEDRLNELKSTGIVPGVLVSEQYPEIPGSVLVTVTEMNTQEECRWLAANM
ncbi:MAG: aminomethyl-transferring glycine dehydrogenase subunit GcvPA [Deltaproteobacteria bacterium]|nr:aminomethyl-transferring glycine dehydrogenase subunit GcvPA [Deltaproteobacteria bacterium]